MSDDIAIVGLAGRFGPAADAAAFYESLLDGRCLLHRDDGGPPRSAGASAGAEPGQPVRPGRAPQAERPGFVPVSCSMEDSLSFDASAYGLTRREAAVMDPQHRVLLDVVRTAVEDVGESLADETVGVFASAALSSYMAHRLLALPEGERPPEYSLLLGNDKDFVASRIAYLMGFTGPAAVVQSACSSSLLAMHTATMSLLGGECTVAVVGGVSIAYPRARGYLYQEGGILSPTGCCRPFDAAADGTVRGDGAGAVVLMLGDDARERGVPAYAAIESVAANNDGSRRAGYTAPSPSGQAEVIRAAHERAGTLDGRVGYVEAHGTGTPLGDPIEVRGLSQVLAPSASGAPVRLGSLKANVGHLDVAAGIASLIKVALMRQRGEIPPQIRFERPNPELGIERTSLVIGAERAPWPEDRPYAGVSAFGIGGTNVHAVVGPWTGRTRDRAPVPGPDRREMPVLIWGGSENRPGAGPSGPTPSQHPTPPRRGRPSSEDVISLFAEFVDPPVSADTDFFDAGGDSLGAVELVEQVRRRWGASSFTINDFEAAPTPAGLLGALDVPGDDSSRLVELRAGRAGSPVLVLVHPAGGTVSRYRVLLGSVPGDWTVAAVPFIAPGVSGPPSVNDLAVHYSRLVMERFGRASGDIVLGGFSLGGNLAHEMVAVSEPLARRTLKVIMLDAMTPESYPDSPPPEETLLRAGRAVMDGQEPTAVDAESAMTDIWRVTTSCLYGYRPSATIATPVSVIAAEAVSPVLESLGISPEPAARWERWCAGGVTVSTVPCDHYSMLSDRASIDRVGVILAEILSAYDEHDNGSL